MAKQKAQNPEDFIMPLNMNGLQGRMLHMPAPNKKRTREILLIYGHHALIERWWGLAQNLNAYGAVTIPDLPGFGGMDSFHKIGKKPTIDNYADYLAAFIKLRYKRRRVTIAGISFGFVVVTRMLQRYPELANRIDFVISIVGFMHRDDFLFTPRDHFIAQHGCRVVSWTPIAFFVRHVCLNKFVIRTIYKHWGRAKHRVTDILPEQFNDMLDMEVVMWQANDVRTHWATTSEFLDVDNCGVPINLPVWHVRTLKDHYFDNNIVEQHMRVVFSDYRQADANISSHTPSVLAGKKEFYPFLPAKLRRALAARP
ncbi:MAG TPA: alpha/beta hydrolase [Candidatus Saccharimonadales bacterium]|nr:alpha/beta hydrolase [Candidatus Saccharimonadales bacterium]